MRWQAFTSAAYGTVLTMHCIHLRGIRCEGSAVFVSCTGPDAHFPHIRTISGAKGVLYFMYWAPKSSKLNLGGTLVYPRKNVATGSVEYVKQYSIAWST
jgi:hypothetical protein